MARINLLPWREELRERKNKEFLTVLVFSLLLGLAAAFAAWTYFNNELSDQRAANENIIAENKKLDAELAEIEILEQRREEIISRMRVIQDLQGKRPLPVRVWDDVAKAIPPAMYLVEFKRQENVFTLKGYADNPNIVSELVRNLDGSEWLDNSKVDYIKQNISAYDKELPTKTPTSEEEDKVTYPEDSYVEFVVTTEVQAAVPEEEQDKLADDGQASVVAESEQVESSPESQTSTGDE